MSEFVYNTLQGIYKDWYEGLYKWCEFLFNNIFDSFNNNVQNAAGELTQSPQSWNSGAFNITRTIADNACIPIAGVVITVIFCWEIVHIAQESNNMHSIKPDTIVMALIKLIVCLLVVSKSFEIIMAFFELGAFATSQIANTTVGSFGDGLDISTLLPKIESDYSIVLVLQMIAYTAVLAIARVITFASGVIIYMRTVLWFLELLIYSSAAPIPFATFGNREWSQMGLNYTRKMLAVCFEGFFMLLAFALYGGVVTGIYQGGGDFIESLFMMIGCGIVLIIILGKTGNISASIFNAH